MENTAKDTAYFVQATIINEYMYDKLMVTGYTHHLLTLRTNPSEP